MLVEERARVATVSFIERTTIRERERGNCRGEREIVVGCVDGRTKGDKESWLLVIYQR